MLDGPTNSEHNTGGLDFLDAEGIFGNYVKAKNAQTGGGPGDETAIVPFTGSAPPAAVPATTPYTVKEPDNATPSTAIVPATTPYTVEEPDNATPSTAIVPATGSQPSMSLLQKVEQFTKGDPINALYINGNTTKIASRKSFGIGGAFTYSFSSYMDMLEACIAKTEDTDLVNVIISHTNTIDEITLLFTKALQLPCFLASGEMITYEEATVQFDGNEKSFVVLMNNIKFFQSMFATIKLATNMEDTDSKTYKDTLSKLEKDLKNLGKSVEKNPAVSKLMYVLRNLSDIYALSTLLKNDRTLIAFLKGEDNGEIMDTSTLYKNIVEFEITDKLKKSLRDVPQAIIGKLISNTKDVGMFDFIKDVGALDDFIAKFSPEGEISSDLQTVLENVKYQLEMYDIASTGGYTDILHPSDMIFRVEAKPKPPRKRILGLFGGMQEGGAEAAETSTVGGHYNLLAPHMKELRQQLMAKGGNLKQYVQTGKGSGIFSGKTALTDYLLDIEETLKVKYNIVSAKDIRTQLLSFAVSRAMNPTFINEVAEAYQKRMRSATDVRALEANTEYENVVANSKPEDTSAFDAFIASYGTHFADAMKQDRIAYKYFSAYVNGKTSDEAFTLPEDNEITYRYANVKEILGGTSFNTAKTAAAMNTAKAGATFDIAMAAFNHGSQLLQGLTFDNKQKSAKMKSIEDQIDEHFAVAEKEDTASKYQLTKENILQYRKNFFNTLLQPIHVSVQEQTGIIGEKRKLIDDSILINIRSLIDRMKSNNVPYQDVLNQYFDYISKYTSTNRDIDFDIPYLKLITNTIQQHFAQSLPESSKVELTTYITNLNDPMFIKTEDAIGKIYTFVGGLFYFIFEKEHKVIKAMDKLKKKNINLKNQAQPLIDKYNAEGTTNITQRDVKRAKKLLENLETLEGEITEKITMDKVLIADFEELKSDVEKTKGEIEPITKIEIQPSAPVASGPSTFSPASIPSLGRQDSSGSFASASSSLEVQKGGAKNRFDMTKTFAMLSAYTHSASNGVTPLRDLLKTTFPALNSEDALIYVGIPLVHTCLQIFGETTEGEDATPAFSYATVNAQNAEKDLYDRVMMNIDECITRDMSIEFIVPVPVYFHLEGHDMNEEAAIIKSRDQPDIWKEILHISLRELSKVEPVFAELNRLWDTPAVSTIVYYSSKYEDKVEKIQDYIIDTLGLKSQDAREFAENNFVLLIGMYPEKAVAALKDFKDMLTPSVNQKAFKEAQGILEKFQAADIDADTKANYMQLITTGLTSIKEPTAYIKTFRERPSVQKLTDVYKRFAVTSEVSDMISALSPSVLQITEMEGGGKFTKAFGQKLTSFKSKIASLKEGFLSKLDKFKEKRIAKRDLKDETQWVDRILIGNNNELRGLTKRVMKNKALQEKVDLSGGKIVENSLREIIDRAPIVEKFLGGDISTISATIPSDPKTLVSLEKIGATVEKDIAKNQKAEKKRIYAEQQAVEKAEAAAAKEAAAAEKAAAAAAATTVSGQSPTGVASSDGVVRPESTYATPEASSVVGLNNTVGLMSTPSTETSGTQQTAAPPAQEESIRPYSEMMTEAPPMSQVEEEPEMPKYERNTNIPLPSMTPQVPPPQHVSTNVPRTEETNHIQMSQTGVRPVPQGVMMPSTVISASAVNQKIKTSVDETIALTEQFVETMKRKKDAALSDITEFLRREYGSLSTQMKEEYPPSINLKSNMKRFYNKFVDVLAINLDVYYKTQKRFFMRDNKIAIALVLQQIEKDGYEEEKERYMKAMQTLDQVNDAYYREMTTLLENYSGSGVSVMDEEYAKPMTKKLAQLSERIAKDSAKIKSFYTLRYSIIMDFLMDPQVMTIYVIKALRIGFAYLAAYLTTKVFSPMYEEKVYDKKENPPSLLQYLFLFFAFDACFNVFILIVLYLLKFIFSNDDNAFVIDNYLFKKYAIDYISGMVIILTIGSLVGSVITQKKYFKYKYEGLRAIRAYQTILFYMAMIIIILPLFAIF